MKINFQSQLVLEKIYKEIQGENNKQRQLLNFLPNKRFFVGKNKNLRYWSLGGTLTRLEPIRFFIDEPQIGCPQEEIQKANEKGAV